MPPSQINLADRATVTSIDISKLKEGDQRVWNDAFGIMRPIAVKAAYSFFENKFQAEDVADEAIARVYANRNEIEDEDHLRRFTYVVAWNLADDIKQKQVRRNSDDMVDKVSIEIYEAVEQEEVLPDLIAEQNDLRKACKMLIDGLPKIFRQLAYDHILQGMTIDEIVELRKRPRGTVSNYLARAQALLQTNAAKNPQMREIREDYHPTGGPK